MALTAHPELGVSRDERGSGPAQAEGKRSERRNAHCSPHAAKGPRRGPIAAAAAAANGGEPAAPPWWNLRPNGPCNEGRKGRRLSARKE